jgi:hypothetical protein
MEGGSLANSSVRERLGAVVNSFSFLYAEHAKEGALVQLWVPQGNVLTTKVHHTCCRLPCTAAIDTAQQSSARCSVDSIPNSYAK